MAAGASTTDRSPSEPSRIVTTVCASPSRPVDVWRTQGGSPQVHRPNNSSKNRSSNRNSKRSRPEQNEKCVTHVAGQKCYPCRRLLTGTERKPDLGPVRGRFHKLRLGEAPPHPDLLPARGEKETALRPGHVRSFERLDARGEGTDTIRRRCRRPSKPTHCSWMPPRPSAGTARTLAGRRCQGAIDRASTLTQ